MHKMTHLIAKFFLFNALIIFSTTSGYLGADPIPVNPQIENRMFNYNQTQEGMNYSNQELLPNMPYPVEQSPVYGHDGAYVDRNINEWHGGHQQWHGQGNPNWNHHDNHFNHHHDNYHNHHENNHEHQHNHNEQHHDGHHDGHHGGHR